MKTYDLVELATRNLRESVLRNSLTTIGIGVGVASLVAMLSLGIGLQQMATRRLERSGLFDTVVVSPHIEFRGPGRMPTRTEPDKQRPLDQDARREMEKLPEVAEVYPGIRALADVNFGGKSHYSMIGGLPMSARERDAFESLKGRFFSGAQAEEALLAYEFAKELDANPDALIGQEITLKYPKRQQMGGAAAMLPFGGFSVLPAEQKLRIVGVMKEDPEGGLGALGRGRVYLPVQLAEKLDIMQASDLRDPMRMGRGGYMSLVVRLKNTRDVEKVEAAVQKMGFSAFSLLDATKQLRNFFAIFDLFLGIFGSVALAVASLGIVNTLVMAVLERRREIGIMKAIGADNGDIKRLFFAEAGCMGLLGGALGVALGWTIGRVINFGANVYLQRQQLPTETFWRVPWWLVAAAIGFSILVSLAAGLYPAARAAKLDPVQSLRWE